jgi:imidazolonepropionase-like amidohydrolase
MVNNDVYVLSELLIDGTGQEALQHGIVHIEAGKIKQVGQKGDFSIPRGATLIDGSGFTLLPGLIDAHIHLTGRRRKDWVGQYDSTLRTSRAIADAYNLLEHGVTAARCCGSPYTPGIKRAIEEGTIVGPRFVTASAYISQTCGHGDIHHLPLHWAQQIRVIADGISACRRAVRQQVRQGADFIKVMAGGGTSSQLDELEHPQFSVDELCAMVYEAHSAGKPIAAHAHGLTPIKHALHCGVDVIEHGTAIDEAAAQQVADSGRYIVRNCYTPIRVYEQTQGFTNQGDYSDWAFRRHKINYQHNRMSVKLCRQIGCKQAIGPDVSGCEPYDVIPKTMNAFMELGDYTALEAISCCTQTGSEVLGLCDTIGTLEQDKIADLILVEGNPLNNIMVLAPKTNIRLVMKGGQILINRDVPLSTTN